MSEEYNFGADATRRKRIAVIGGGAAWAQQQIAEMYKQSEAIVLIPGRGFGKTEVAAGIITEEIKMSIRRNHIPVQAVELTPAPKRERSTGWQKNVSQVKLQIKTKKMSWIQTLNNKDLPTGIEVIGYNQEWIDEDFNPNGTMVGHFTDGNTFTCAKWCNYHDQYENREGTHYPTHYMDMPKFTI